MIRSLRPFLFLAIFCLSAFLLISLLRVPFQPDEVEQFTSAQEAQQTNCDLNPPKFEEILCFIDSVKENVSCVKQRDQSEVFLPFNKFLKKQFDISGQFDKGNFNYYTSEFKTGGNENTKEEDDEQNPLDNLGKWNVAMRPRVRCLSPSNALPMSVQWEPTKRVPYFYPVQVLQFGLEHFAKNRTLEKQPVRRSLAKRMMGNRPSNGKLLQIENGQAVDFKLLRDLSILFFTWKSNGPEAGFELHFMDKSGEELRLLFRHSTRRECVWIEEDGENEQFQFIYGLNREATCNFTEFLLDMPVFVEKALALLGNGSQRRRDQNQDFLPHLLRFTGPIELHLDSIRQQSTAHEEITLRVANWLLENQDHQGGWPVPIRRDFDIDEGRHKLTLLPGWHSAMAQGHALSFLSRLFVNTKDRRFLEPGEKALALFELPASEGGVVNQMFGHNWFEEYPTTPNGTFVLNGFMYALIGLHDFSAHSNRSMALFKHGVHSLKTLLPLFDTGQRSLYDLRHFHLGSWPNIARWDYHNVHIQLLNWLHLVTGEPRFGEMARRWTGYAHGASLKHN